MKLRLKSKAKNGIFVFKAIYAEDTGVQGFRG